MKTLIAMSAALALAACGNRADTTAEATPGDTATATGAMAEAPATTATATQAATGSMAGKYEITMADGRVTTQNVRSDGTYTDLADGKETKGTWRMDGARSCFDPEGAAAERCYTNSAIAADGSFTATGPDNKQATVRKVAARADM